MTALTAPALNAEPSFNLLDQPWIGAVLPDGSVEQVSILACLTRAHELRAFYDPSPLATAGVHRLLAAILQDIYRPRRVDDVAKLLQQGRFDAVLLADYADQYRARFDLFSADAPFLQTSDLSLVPTKTDAAKPVSTLFCEEPAATNIVHFWHAYDHDQAICPACAAVGLIIQPAFATSGGAGIRPSINGVPPLYAFPAGVSLFETLTLSLMASEYQPRARESNGDAPPWGQKTTVVGRSEEISRVGYLESLTFAARRMRLHPRVESGRCTRCSRQTTQIVRTTVYEMGRSRPRDAPLWQDPFAAYRQPKDKEPVPLRPQPGKLLWREYGTLFLSKASPAGVLAPAVVQQLADLEYRGAISEERLFQFRCIGLRTDMKAKVFEWVDETLDLPMGLLKEPASTQEVRLGIERAEECERELNSIFRKHFGPPGGKRDRFKGLRERMSATYWTGLSAAFREFALSAGTGATLAHARENWIKTVVGSGQQCFEEAVEGVGDRGSDLRKRVEAVQACRIRLASHRKEWLNG